MITKGQQVTIKPEAQDAGDDQFTWVAVENEDGGRVKISPVGTGMSIPPVMVVNVSDLVGN